MKIQYEKFNFRTKAMDTIERANIIIDDMASDGWKLSLRQLYYQFVSNDWIENTEKSYNNLGSIISKARLNGDISWHAIEDRGRNHNFWNFQENTGDIVSKNWHNVLFDLWDRQDRYVEVWVEKDALSGVIEKPCSKYRVPYMACKGYMSSSAAWEAGQRFMSANKQGKKCTLIHLGDHDPSGIDMTRDNDDRLSVFSESNIDVRRIALNMEQIRRYNPPPNPAKLTDSRANDYVNKFGNSSWELDALEPKTMVKLIEDEITSLINFDVWRETLSKERDQEEILKELSINWDDVQDFLASIRNVE